MEELERKACARNARIVYPEPQDARIVAAAEIVARKGVARPILVGLARDLPQDPPEGVELEAVDGSPRLEELAATYGRARKVNERLARRLLSKPLAYGCMMVRCGLADGIVAGIAHPTAAVLQSAGLTIGHEEGSRTASSCFIMVLRRLRNETQVPVVFADCAVVVEPSAEQLADIALASAGSARMFLGLTPRVAMLSFSTAGSASHARVEKVRQATRLAAARITDGYVEGEMQFDAAVDPEVAAKKGVEGGQVAGRANVFVFPDLDSGNCCYKAVRCLAGAQAIGPILQGFARPVSDLSRSASVEDVVGTTVITVLQGAESS